MEIMQKRRSLFKGLRKVAPSPAKEFLRTLGGVVAEAVSGGDDVAVVDEAPSAAAPLHAHLYPRHPRPHVDRVVSPHYLK